MIGLPANKTEWPPNGTESQLERVRIHDAWYSGDPARLASVHGSAMADATQTPGTTLNPAGLVKRAAHALSSRFWARSSADEVDTKRHLPTPEDIARHSARVLFSESIQIKVLGPVYDADSSRDADGNYEYRKGDARPETVAAQRRLDQNLVACKFDALLLAGAEIGSALGSTGLRIAYDVGSIGPRPIITRVDPDGMIPVFSWGQQVGVMFWQQVRLDTGGTVWRHIELHTQGLVYHGLYKGSADNIGERQSLDADPTTANLAPLVNAEGAIVIDRNGGKTATSIPNMLPDPLDRRNHIGRSDYTPAVLDLFDAIDRTFSQMMDAIEDAKSRILVSESMLQNDGIGKGRSFDINQRVFTRVKVPPAEREGGGLPIEKVQFEMHVQEYLMAIAALVRMAIEAAGYNSRSDAGEGGRDVTATEIKSDDGLSMGTRDAKIRYWQPELQDLLTTYVAVDVQKFQPRDPATGLLIQAYPVEVTFPDAIQPTKLDLAMTAKALKEAGAASVESLVRTVNPEWTDRQIDEEVELILSAASVVDPVSFGTAGLGIGAGDGA